MFERSSVGLKYLVLLIVLSFATGSLRTELILLHIGPDHKPIVRASAYLSLLIGSLFSFLILLFSFYITTLVQPNQYKNQVVPYFTYGIRHFALVVMTVELIKIILVFLFLTDELDDMDVRQIANQLRQTTWYKADALFNVVAIAVGAFAFADTVRNESKGALGVKSLLWLALPVAVLLTIAQVVQF